MAFEGYIKMVYGIEYIIKWIIFNTLIFYNSFIVLFRKEIPDMNYKNNRKKNDSTEDNYGRHC